MATKADNRRDIPKPIISDLYDFSDQALTQLKTWIEQSGLQIPVSQLVGNATIPATPTAQDIADVLVALNLAAQA